MPSYKKFFVQAIKRNYPDNFAALIDATNNHYQVISKDTAFAKTSSNPIDRRLDFCAYFLALIKTLDHKDESFEKIRSVCLEVVLEYVKPRNKFHAWLKQIPPKLIDSPIGAVMVKFMKKKFGQNDQDDGFLAEVITDKNETYGFGYGVDITRCGICILFKKHNFEKYASILCEVDEVTSSLAGLKLIRTSTIALGANKCDFRYTRTT